MLKIFCVMQGRHQNALGLHRDEPNNSRWFVGWRGAGVLRLNSGLEHHTSWPRRSWPRSLLVKAVATTTKMIRMSKFNSKPGSTATVCSSPDTVIDKSHGDPTADRLGFDMCITIQFFRRVVRNQGRNKGETRLRSSIKSFKKTGIRSTKIDWQSST